MKKVIAVAMLAGMVLVSGCLSSAVTYKTSREYTQKVIQARVENNTPFLGVDVLGFTQAYLQSWQEHPWLMSGATLGDIGTAVGLALIGYDQGKSKSTDASLGTIAVPNTVSGDIVIIGNQNSVEHVWENQK